MKRLIILLLLAVPCFAQTPPQLDMFGGLTGSPAPASASWINTTVSSGAITGSLSPQTFTLASVTGVAIWNWLTIDAGAAPVQVTGESLGTVASGTVQYKVTLAHGNYLPGSGVLKVNGVAVAYDLGAFAKDSSASAAAQENGLLQTGILVDAGLVTTGTSNGAMAVATGLSTDPTPYENFLSVQNADPTPSAPGTAVQELLNIVFQPAFSTAHNGQAITFDYKYSPAEDFVVQNLSGSNVTATLMNSHAANAPITQGTWYFAKVNVGAVPTWVECDPIGFCNDQFAMYGTGQDQTSGSHMSLTVNTTAATAITTTGVLTTIAPVSMAGICNGCYVTFSQGTANEETEQVSNVTGSTFQFTPTYTHAANYTIEGYYYNGVAFGQCLSSGGCSAGTAGTTGGKYYGNKGFWAAMQIIRQRGWGYNIQHSPDKFGNSWVAPLYTLSGGGTIPYPTADHSQIAKMPFSITNDVTYYGSFNHSNYNNASLTGCGGGVTPGVTGANGDIDYSFKNTWTTYNGVTTGAAPGNFIAGSFADFYDSNMNAYLCGWLKNGSDSGLLSNNHENPWLAFWQGPEGDYIRSFGDSKRTGYTAWDSTYVDYGSRKELFMPYHLCLSLAGNGSYIPFANCTNNNKAGLIAALTTEYTTIAALNSAWGSSYASFLSTGGQDTGTALSPTPNGVATTFTATLPHIPDRGGVQVFASNGSVLCADLPGGGISGAYTSTGTCQGSALISSSTIQYTTATNAISITFSSAPASGAALTANSYHDGFGKGTGLADEDGTCPAFSASCATVWGTSAYNIQLDGNAAFQADMATLLGDMAAKISGDEKIQVRALMPHTPIVSDYALGSHGVPSDPAVYQNWAPNVDAIAYNGFDPNITNSGGFGPQGISPYQYVNDYAGDKPEVIWAGVNATNDSVMNLRCSASGSGIDPTMTPTTQAGRATLYGLWITQLGIKGTYTGTNTFTGIHTWQFEDNYSECSSGIIGDLGNWGMVSAEDNPYDGVHDTTGTTAEYIGNNAFTPTPELHNYGDLIDPVRIDIVNQENSLLGATLPPGTIAPATSIIVALLRMLI